MHNTAIVILNYNGVAHLKKFLPSVLKHSENIATIYVADNNSTDNSVELLSSEFPQIKQIRLQKNWGFAGGYNEALKEIKEEYCVLLNSDVEVTSNWIPPVLDILSSSPDIVACQPKIKDFNKKSHFEYAGAAGGFIDQLGYPYCKGRIFDSIEEDTGQYDENEEIFWATGACLFIKTKAFNEVNGFDSDYFAHMEEIDLCWRLKNKGYKVFYCYQSTVYHVGGGTLNKNSPHKTYLNFRNSLFNLVKNLPKEEITKKVFIRLMLDGLAGVKFLLEGNISHLIAIIKAHFNFYAHYGIVKRKRNTIRDFSKHKLLNSIVFQYYIKGQKLFSKLG